MLDTRVEDITKEDIESLVTNRVHEGRTLDYKAQLPGGGDEERRSFLIDVSAFANTLGGTILFGIPELIENGQKTGLPANCDGLQGLNADSEQLRLENSIRDGIEPRIPGIQFKVIDGFKNGSILLLRIPQSFASPHMVTFKNLARFYTRISAGNSQMDVSEIRSAFLAAEAIPERIRRFHRDRIAKVLATDLPVRLNGTSIVALHLIPLSSMRQQNPIDLKSMVNRQLTFDPLFGDGVSRFNLDGIIVREGEINDSMSYAQIYRSGVIEAVDAYILSNETREKQISSVMLEGAIRSGVLKYLQLMSNLDITGQISLFLSILGVRGWRMKRENFSFHPGRASEIDRDNVILPEVVFDNPSVNIDKVLRPVFDMVWQACGLPRCMTYDSDGNWGKIQ